MNKKIIYLSVFLVLALFLISSCQSSVKGVKVQQKKVVEEEQQIDDPGFTFRFSQSSPKAIDSHMATSCENIGDSLDPYKAGYSLVVYGNQTNITETTTELQYTDQCLTNQGYEGSESSLTEYYCSDDKIFAYYNVGTCNYGCNDEGTACNRPEIPGV
jgi:hypothetical protein